MLTISLLHRSLPFICQFILLFLANPITLLSFADALSTLKSGQFPRQVLRPFVLLYGMQYMQ
jgi:hypothetical protein